MQSDSKQNFEFEAFKECKIVRENLLSKYNELNKDYEQNIEIYANLHI